MTRFYFLLFLFCATALPASRLTVAGLAESYENPILGPSAPVRDLAFSSGNLRLVMATGDAAPVIAGDQTVGLFFRGSGSLTYASVDPLEKVVSLFNAEKATRLKVKETANGLQFQTPFEQALIWAPPGKLPELAPGDGAAVQQHFEKHREWFTRDWFEPPSLLFLKSRLEGPSATIVRAEVTAGDDQLVYHSDPVHQQSERLYSLIKRKSIVESLRPIILSDQPIGRDRRDFQNPELILSDMVYELTASDGKDAKISVTETLVPVGRDQRVFRLNQLSQVYYRGKRYYRVTSVKDGAGRPLPYFHKYNNLVVELPEAVPAEQPFKIRFEIEGDFLIRPEGDSYWQLGLGPWFPMPDYRGRYFTVHSTVRVKKPFVPLAPGKTLSRHEEGDYNVLVNQIDKPVFGTVVLAGKYRFAEETKKGVTIRVATYGGKVGGPIKELTNLCFKIIDFYEPYLGPFPFPEYNIIEINSFGFGQGPPATMYITQEAFNPRVGQLNRLFSQGINHRIAHEVAHQYWGHVVRAAGSEDTWIHESFAEYSSAFVVKRLRGKTGYNALVADWKSDAKEAHELSSIPLANRIMNPAERDWNFRRRNQLIYDKGAYLLTALHRELGDDMFFSFLRSAQGNFAWRLVNTRNLIALLEHMTKRDFDPFFDRYYWGMEMPE